MDFRVEYRHRGILEYVHLSSCENIMDALYKFYEAHGINTEILCVFTLTVWLWILKIRLYEKL